MFNKFVNEINKDKQNYGFVLLIAYSSLSLLPPLLKNNASWYTCTGALITAWEG